MFKINADYTDYRNDTDLNMPGGAAIPASTPQSFDGTPWRYKWFNHLHGFFQALFIDAFGSLDTISGQPDNAFESDGLKAIKRIIDKKFDGQFLIKEISGENPVIPLSEIPYFVSGDQITYSPEKNYVVFISPHGYYPDFFNIAYELNEEGLHVFPRKLLNGKSVPGIGLKPWGEGLWGEGLWGEFGSMPINIIIKETV